MFGFCAIVLTGGSKASGISIILLVCITRTFDLCTVHSTLHTSYARQKGTAFQKDYVEVILFAYAKEQHASMWAFQEKSNLDAENCVCI